MGIKKVTLVDRIEIVENGSVQIRTATKIIEDDQVISQSFQRHVIAPGADYSKEDNRVRAICVAAHTPEVVAAYRTSVAQSQESAA